MQTADAGTRVIGGEDASQGRFWLNVGPSTVGDLKASPASARR
jgi:hypothetical protein